MALYAKLWTDILGDPKLMRAARKGAKQLALLPWLIAFAKRADDGGALTVNGEPAEAIDIADQVPGVTPRQVADCIAALEALGVLVRDGDVLRFAAWETRSGQGRPSDAPDAVRERVQRHRIRKRLESHDGVTPCNDVTETRGNAGELEQELEQEQEQEQEATAATPARAATELEALVAVRLPTDADRNALTALIAVAPRPHAWLGEMNGALGGMGGHHAVTPEQLGQALRDYVANGEAPNLSRFRGYLRKAAKRRPSPPDDDLPGAATGTDGLPPRQPIGVGGRAYLTTLHAIKDL